MVLILVIGDLHIPFRCHDLPPKFRKLLVPGKIQQVLTTGNICDPETLEWLKSISGGDVKGVAGEWDENSAFPETLVIQHGQLKIGIVHGHQIVPLGDTDALCAMSRQLSCDVLITGATHRFEAFEFDSKFFLNPGSATGAFTFSSLPMSQTNPDKPYVIETTEPISSEEPIQHEAQPDDSLFKSLGFKASASSTQGRRRIAPDPNPSFALLDVQGNVIVTYVYQLVEGEVRVEKIEFRKE